ncbi:MAG: hypothetical protein DRO67_07065 [Candidatus Asgardarchaeum californiense]|nr:MAG: hypothetical protein DRO67_07065 [Candidatus Asgardarchaeum californiense]
MTNLDITLLLFEYLIFPGFLFSSGLGILLLGLRRKFRARIQGRRGPPILQPLYDLLKLLVKEDIEPATANKTAYKLAPILSFASVTLVSALIPIGYYVPQLSFTGDIILIFYFLSMLVFAVIIGGSSSSNPYSAVSAARFSTMLIVFELPLVFTIATMAVWSKSLMLINIVSVKKFRIESLILLPTAIAYLFYIMAKLHLNPFSIPVAETEILEGIYVEYTGRKLALFELSHAIEFSVLTSLFIDFFVPLPDMGWVTIIIHVVLCILLAILITFIEAIFARIRIDQFVKIFGVYVNLLAILGFIIVLFLMGW